MCVSLYKPWWCVFDSGLFIVKNKNRAGIVAGGISFVKVLQKRFFKQCEEL